MDAILATIVVIDQNLSLGVSNIETYHSNKKSQDGHTTGRIPGYAPGSFPAGAESQFLS